MPGVFGTLLDLALFVATVAWVGKRPTAAKVTVLIAVVAALQVGTLVRAAMLQGTGVSEWYLASLDRQMKVYEQVLGAAQMQSFMQTAAVVARFWPAICVAYGAACVFFALVLRWLFNRFIVHKSEWTALTKVDLPVWTVVPLIVAIALYAVHLVPDVPGSEQVMTVAMNVAAMSVVPFFVQGAAVTKDVMNRLNLGIGWQIVIAIAGLLVSAALFVLPIVGLADYWANFRHLPRGEATVGELD